MKTLALAVELGGHDLHPAEVGEHEEPVRAVEQLGAVDASGHTPAPHKAGPCRESRLRRAGRCLRAVAR